MADWRKAEHRAAWRTYFETSLRLEARLDEELRATSGLSMVDYHVLLLLSEAQGRRMRMGELAARMVFSSSRLTYQIKAMEQRGWVAREPSADDRRVSYAVLTSCGSAVFREAGPHHVRAVKRLFLDDVDEDELRVLASVFGRVRHRLDETSSRVQPQGGPNERT